MTLSIPQFLFGQSSTSGLVRGSSKAVKAFTEPYRSIDLAASEMGALSSVEVREGDLVKRDQILGRLNEDVLAAGQAMIEQSIRATGKLDAAKAELKVQEETFEKVQGLFRRKHASQVELDRASGQVEIAKARVEAVLDDINIKKYELKRVVAQIEQRRVRSPIDGVVTEIFKDEGEFVSSADPIIFRVVQLDPLLVVFSLPESHATRLKSGMPITIAMGPSKHSAEAVTEFVSPVADAQSGTYRVRLRVPNSKQQWRSGVPCYFIPELAFRRAAKSIPSKQASATDSVRKRQYSLPSEKEY